MTHPNEQQRANPSLIINGPLAYADTGPNRLADKYMRLLLLHNEARMTVSKATRLPGLSVALAVVKARLMELDV